MCATDVSVYDDVAIIKDFLSTCDECGVVYKHISKDSGYQYFSIATSKEDLEEHERLR